MMIGLDEPAREPLVTRRAPEPGTPADGLWSPRTRLREVESVAVLVLLAACTLVTVLTTLGIVAILGTETVRFFRVAEVGLGQFLTGREVDPPHFGILPLIWGTSVVAAGSSLIALPIGLLSAIYLSEYAPRKVRATLKPALELLAGIPTIVYGFLALQLVTPVLRWMLEPLGFRVQMFNALSACIVVGVMIIPMVSSLSEDVLSAVPRGLREAAYGLGATKFEVSTRVVLPAALSGVVASFILAISRAVGETMAVVLAAGSVPNITPNLLVPIETMTTYIVAVVGGEEAPGSPKSLSLFAVAMVLFAITLSMNIVSRIVLARFREVYH